MLKDLLASIFHPSEVSSMLKLKFGSYVRPVSSQSLEELAVTLNDVDFCYAVLNKVSRSFAVVIQQLPAQLRDPICIFYLALRGLDSVEDDMTYDVKSKIPLLQTFYQKLYIDNWSIENVGDSDEYRILLKHFYKVIRVFKSLPEKYQSVIAIITRKMGEGMAEFADKTGSIDTVSNYNLYCHYVAGLVGHGLSELFAASGLEDSDLALQERLSNSMGLFLQKTNIIRDYLEDCEAGRTWWPEEIWSMYGNSLDEFSKHPNSEKSLSCLNAMVNDALSHVPDCLDYLSRLHNKQIFEFCAIPQTMAIATLCEVYDNPEVLKRNVKVRKGMAAKMMLESSNLIQVKAWFREFTDELQEKLKLAQEHTVKPDINSKTNTNKNNNNNKNGKLNGNGNGNHNGNNHNQNNNNNNDESRTLLHHNDSSFSSHLASHCGVDRTQSLLNQIRSLTAPGTDSPSALSYLNLFAWLIFLLATFYLFTRFRSRVDSEDNSRFGSHHHSFDSRGPGFGLMASGLDVLAVLVCFVSIGYLFGFFGISYI